MCKKMAVYNDIQDNIYDIIKKYVVDPTPENKKVAINRIYGLYKDNICEYNLIYQILLERAMNINRVEKRHNIDYRDTFLYDICTKHNTIQRRKLQDRVNAIKLVQKHNTKSKDQALIDILTPEYTDHMAFILMSYIEEIIPNANKLKVGETYISTVPDEECINVTIKRYTDQDKEITINNLDLDTKLTFNMKQTDTKLMYY